MQLPSKSDWFQEKSEEEIRKEAEEKEQRRKQFEPLRLKAENGNPNAQYEYAAQDFLSSVEEEIWLCRAADAGHPEARFDLGRSFEFGLYPRKPVRNPVNAYKWYSLAEKSGAYRAAEAKHRVADTLTPEQIAEAERLVAEWQPSQCEAEVKDDSAEAKPSS